MNINRLHKTKYWNLIKTLAILIAIVVALGTSSPAGQNVAKAETTAGIPSHNVAYIDSLSVIMGGSFPTTTTGPTGSFLDFHFYQLPYTEVSLSKLYPGGVCGAEGCDTVLLNVASTGIYCNLGRLTAQQKADLVTFASLGNKLIIYDSECPSQDYSWLPYPFSTNNPGPLGQTGTLWIVEENTLSSSDTTSPYYIDYTLLSSTTDAVGDMNVMTSFDQNWYLDMAGINYLDFAGPVHTYAGLPSGSLPSGEDVGLIIYNGLDVDYMSYYSIPDTNTGANNLAKIWLQELQQLFNPCGLGDIGINLSPINATLYVYQDHTVTATLTDEFGALQEGILVDFSIQSGPNTGAMGTCNPVDCQSDVNGEVTFTYTGTGGPGADTIRGCFTNADMVNVCSYAFADWLDIMYVDIDIKPKSPSNTISLSSGGLIPVAILTNEYFDASSVDYDTVQFEDASVRKMQMTDVDEDGDVDMLLSFMIEDLTLTIYDNVGFLWGNTYDGIYIYGADIVRIPNSGPNPYP
jgi:hypothetical protein